MIEKDTKAKNFHISRFFTKSAIEAMEEACRMGVSDRECCEDAISRQDVLDLMQMRMGAKELYKAVYDLPSVAPAQKKGKWIRVDRNKVKCSECEIIHLIAQYPRGTIDYCPNCGAKMEREE
jgi:hypothetical protein